MFRGRDRKLALRGTVLLHENVALDRGLGRRCFLRREITVSDVCVKTIRLMTYLIMASVKLMNNFLYSFYFHLFFIVSRADSPIIHIIHAIYIYIFFKSVTRIFIFKIIMFDERWMIRIDITPNIFLHAARSSIIGIQINLHTMSVFIVTRKKLFHN